MEDVLDVYCRPYDPLRPLLCMDEMGKNLVKEKHPAEPAKPGQTKREDYTYEKKGAGNVFLACEPLAGKRYLKVTKHPRDAQRDEERREAGLPCGLKTLCSC